MVADATLARLLGGAPHLSVGILTADLGHLGRDHLLQLGGTGRDQVEEGLRSEV